MNREGGRSRFLPLSLRGGLIAGTVLLAAGCSYFRYPENPPLASQNDAAGYRWSTIAASEPDSSADETFIILTLSGGGTRAAALAYSVMRELDRHKIAGASSLLDEVDVISSVSGGSFAAAYYGLFGKAEFFERFEREVLHRKIERDLILAMFNPLNWPRLCSPTFGRADLADEYYDQEIFRGRTFATMPRRRPLIMLNATDMTLGARFSFTQDDFDQLCSNMDQVTVSRGVAASSAFPVAFSPLTVRNYDKSQCGYERPAWVRSALKDFENQPSRYERAATARSYEQRRPYIHLYDGGLADNIGLRGPLVALTSTDSPSSVWRDPEARGIKRIVVIVVDAKPGTSYAADKCADPPSIYSVLNAAATNPMENYSADSVELLRAAFHEDKVMALDWERRQQKMSRQCDELAISICTGRPKTSRCQAQVRHDCYAKFRAADIDRPHPLDLYAVHVRFATDEESDTELKQLQGIGTSLQLSDDDVALLVRSGGRILNRSEEFQRLLRDLGAQ